MTCHQMPTLEDLTKCHDGRFGFQGLLRSVVLATSWYWFQTQSGRFIIFHGSLVISNNFNLLFSEVGTKLRNSLKIILQPLKLTFSHLEMDGWNTIVSFWDGEFSGANC